MKDEYICNLGEEDYFKAYRIFFGTLVSEYRLSIISSLRKNKEESEK